MCQDYTAPMPVSGGCPALEAITGAAFAPMAVAGGVSILAYRERDKAAGGKQRLDFFPPEWWEFCLYLNLINLNESEGTKVIWWGRRDGDRENIDNKELRETIWGFLPPSTVLLLCGGRKYECKMLLNSSWHKTSISVVHSGHLDSLDTNITTDLCVTII